jgi:hypothetical protein
MVFWKLRSEVDRKLAADLSRFGIDQDCGEGLGGRIKAEEHGRSIPGDRWISKSECDLFARILPSGVDMKKGGRFRNRP